MIDGSPGMLPRPGAEPRRRIVRAPPMVGWHHHMPARAAGRCSSTRQDDQRSGCAAGAVMVERATPVAPVRAASPPRLPRTPTTAHGAS